MIIGTGALPHYIMALELRDTVVEVEDFTEEEKVLLRKACTKNRNVSGAFGVSESIYEHVGRPPSHQS